MRVRDRRGGILKIFLKVYSRCGEKKTTVWVQVKGQQHFEKCKMFLTDMTDRDMSRLFKAETISGF